MTEKNAPPMTSRPRCLACGRRLRPNYDSTKSGSHIVRKYKKWFDEGLYEVRRTTRDVTEDDFGAKQAEDGRWYIEHTVDEKTRTFQGTFGSYRDGFFCGLRCAYRWAVAVAKKLADEDRQLITYKKDGAAK